MTRKLLTTATIAAVALAAILPAVATAKFRYTHRVMVSGEAIDNWTISSPEDCASVGSGTLSTSFRMKATARVRPFISTTAARHRSTKAGSWVIGVPGGTGVASMRYKPAEGTLTKTDLTVQNPNYSDPADLCYPADKSKCGTTQLTRSFAGVAGYDKRYLYAQAPIDIGKWFDEGCGRGSMQSWDWPVPVMGGDNEFGEMLLKMPRPSQLRKRVTTLTATIHKNSVSPISETRPGTISDDVTRHFTVTFTRIKR